jgi:hypothetical protein
MLNSSSINRYWKYLEAENAPPKYVKKVNVIEFDKLKNSINNKNEIYIKSLVKKMYCGEAFILRKAAKQNLKKIILDLAKHYDKKQKPSFHKMLDGTPNFHRIINKKTTKKYSLYAIKHSYFFYNWNVKTKLEKKFKAGVYSHWRYIKFLAGNNKYQFEKNIPSQNQIDRLQIVNYPLGGGELRDHVDPRKNQRVVTGLIMSKKGVDFENGGFYFRNKNNKKLNIEDKLEIGDAVIFYGSIVHGVEKVDESKKLNWKSYNGRWFIGMFVNDSNHVKNRITANDLSNSTSFKEKAN